MKVLYSLTYEVGTDGYKESRIFLSFSEVCDFIKENESILEDKYMVFNKVNIKESENDTEY